MKYKIVSFYTQIPIVIAIILSMFIIYNDLIFGENNDLRILFLSIMIVLPIIVVAIAKNFKNLSSKNLKMSLLIYQVVSFSILTLFILNRMYLGHDNVNYEVMFVFVGFIAATSELSRRHPSLR